ncbi:hypothetical protein M0R45_027672 [Rubus argutus]|uniref:ABC transporter domain-containing protein n=1 Tax=Rubus argutus TaxID=59490 RepID=A0AAW1X185_RUBAR
MFNIFVFLDIPVGSLVAIVGSTGEGKTSLVSAIYVTTFYFGSFFESSRYQKAIDVIALRYDLDLLPGGDLTETGEGGVNISGGQKQRVPMASVVYSSMEARVLG